MAVIDSPVRQVEKSSSSEDENYMELYVEKELKDKIDPIDE